MAPSVTAVHKLDTSNCLTRPFYLSRVAAGRPSPAEDDVDSTLDLNEHLVRHPDSTYYVEVEGDSMVASGIHDGDILIVDRSVEPAEGSIVIAALDGELTVKRIGRNGDALRLEPASPHHSPIEVSSDNDLVIWGVVRHVIHDLS